jgi:3-(3-hydroxy-phenyl)propionate hydroxylase
VLGPGFALVQVGGAAHAAFAGFGHPFWRTLEARRICVLPGGLADETGAADAVVADIGGAIALAVKRQPVTLLIRPDRYVAAVIAPGQADAAADRLQAAAALAPNAPIVVAKGMSRVRRGR